MKNDGEIDGDRMCEKWRC